MGWSNLGKPCILIGHNRIKFTVNLSQSNLPNFLGTLWQWLFFTLLIDNMTSPTLTVGTRNAWHYTIGTNLHSQLYINLECWIFCLLYWIETFKPIYFTLFNRKKLSQVQVFTYHEVCGALLARHLVGLQWQGFCCLGCLTLKHSSKVIWEVSIVCTVV